MKTEQDIKEYCFELADKGICQGGCEEHIGKIQVVYINNWGHFPYCEEAIAEDKRRGHTVKIVES